MTTFTYREHRNLSKWLLWAAEKLDKAAEENYNNKDTPHYDEDRLDSEAAFYCARLRSYLDMILKRDLPKRYTPELYWREGEAL
jgi:hypothetical protein